ncbi:MAG: serine protease [Sphingobacteriales bacterium]|nr:MAG: serine protease [Sphingobacteriales bacterium]
MAWSKKLTQLNDVLSDLVPYKEGITTYIRGAGLKPQFINMDGNAMDAWSNALSEADKNEKVDDLVKQVLHTYPDNPFLKSALADKEIDYSLSPDIDEISDWQPVTDDTLEVLTMERSTMLPVNFLALGVVRSRSVAKVEIKMSSNRVNVGTGFLCKVAEIADLFFVTNFHVINDKATIKNTRIIFNYELDIDGNTTASKSFSIRENGPWYTSSEKEYDVCVFKLQASDQELKEYGYLNLKETDVARNDFVNIIQHPGGQMKQISLYHNIVTNTDHRIVQYMTDTLKGSSGSPVFNSDWDVVAIHHSGGGSKPGEPNLPQGVKSRNEGINVNKIIKFISANHPKPEQ